MTPTRLVVGSVVQHDLSKPIVQEDSLPIDVPISAWRRDADGHAYRYEGRATTPLPWWQRFPTDMFTDAWPSTLLCPASADVVLAPVPTLDLDAFLTSATRDGYAHYQQPAAKGSQP